MYFSIKRVANVATAATKELGTEFAKQFSFTTRPVNNSINNPVLKVITNAWKRYSTAFAIPFVAIYRVSRYVAGSALDSVENKCTREDGTVKGKPIFTFLRIVGIAAFLVFVYAASFLFGFLFPGLFIEWTMVMFCIECVSAVVDRFRPEPDLAMA